MSRRGIHRTVLLAAAAVIFIIATSASAAGDPNPDAPDWVDADFTIALTPSLDLLELTGTMAVHEADAGEVLASVCGASCTAAELRSIHERGNEMQRERLIAGIEGRALERAHAALVAVAGDGEGIEVHATLDRSTLEPVDGADPNHPPVVVHVTGQAPLVQLHAAGVEPEQLGPLFAMGARVTMPFSEVVEAGNNLTIRFTLPAPLAILDAGMGTLSADGRTASWDVDRWDADAHTLTDSVVVGRPDVHVPTEADMDIHVTVDLSDLEIHYANLLSSADMASITVDVTVDGTFHAIAVPAEIAALVDLPALSADAVRIGLDAALIQREDIDGAEAEARTAIEALFRGSFGQTVEVTGGFDEDALSTADLGEPLGTGPPITLRIAAGSELALPPSEPAPDGLSAFTVATIPLPAIELPDLGLPGSGETSFTIVLPRGVELALPPEHAAVASTTQTTDGRTAVTFTQGDGETSGPITIQGAAVVIEHGAVLSVLWPVLLLLFLVLIVAPALLILTVIARRRKKQRKLAALQAKSQRQGEQRTHPRENAERARAVPGQRSDAPARSD